MRVSVPRRPGSSVRFMHALLVGAFALVPELAAAQNMVSVPFTNGFIGTRASSAGNANNVLTFGTLEIARVFFIQNSSSNAFEIQGNDIPGTMRIVRTNGTTVDIPASVNWRNSGGSTYLIGILPRPASPYTLSYSGGSIQITNGTVNGGTSVGGYVAAYGGVTLANGESTSGNAALGQVLDGLNQYLGTVLTARPQGPVTVNALTTSSTTPTLTGNITLGAGEQLTVTVNNVQYGSATSPAVAVNAGQWSLTLQSPLPNGTYEVTATVTDTDGFTLSDATANELRIATSLTIGGSFTADDKTYDGNTVATGVTSSLALQGVPNGQTVTIASATIAFQNSAVGNGRTVTITGVTLGGANAGDYTVDLTGAPTSSAHITRRALIITGLTGVNRGYDGTTVATISGVASYANLASGENLAVTGAPAAQFANATVGNAKVVSVSGFTAPTANYTVMQPVLSANILPATLTIDGSFTANDKPFDGTRAATIASNSLTLIGAVNGDDVTLGQVTAQFESSDVGVGKTVGLTAATLTGAAASNYAVSLSCSPTTTATIRPAGPTVITIAGSLTANSRVYDGTAVASGSATGLTLQGVTNGHDVQISTPVLLFADAAAGQNKSVHIASVLLIGSDAASYTVSLAGAPTTTASIAPKPVTVVGLTAQSKVYDGTTKAALTGTPSYAGLVPGQAFAVTGTPSAIFPSSSIGTGRAVAVTGFLAPSENYFIAQPAGLAASISPRVVTISGSFTARDKMYDGNNTAQMAHQALVLQNAVWGEAVTLTNVSVEFANAAIGSGKQVSITSATLAGSTSANYTLSLVNAPQTTAAILPASPPSAPRALSGVEGNRQITVSWTAPADEGCAAVSGWVVEYRATGGAWNTLTLKSRLPMQATLASLTNNIPVEVRVASVNSCGTSDFGHAGTFIAVGPSTTDGDNNGGTRPPSVTPGNTQVLSGGKPVTVTTDIVQDTTLRVSGADFSLALLAVDDSGLPIPVDTPVVLQLEHGGHAHTSGSGFAAGTLVTLYLYGLTGDAVLLGRITVLADGTFAHTADVPVLPEGDYTLQVNGINSVGTMRSIAVGVQVAPPPPDLVLTAVPSTNTPTVGDTITITITVTNRGSGAAIDVVIPRAFREAGFDMVAASTQHGTYEDHSQLWRIPRIAAGASARLLLTAIVQTPVSEIRP